MYIHIYIYTLHVFLHKRSNASTNGAVALSPYPPFSSLFSSLPLPSSVSAGPPTNPFPFVPYLGLLQPLDVRVNAQVVALRDPGEAQRVPWFA